MSEVSTNRLGYAAPVRIATILAQLESQIVSCWEFQYDTPFGPFFKDEDWV